MACGFRRACGHAIAVASLSQAVRVAEGDEVDVIVAGEVRFKEVDAG